MTHENVLVLLAGEAISSSNSLATFGLFNKTRSPVWVRVTEKPGSLTIRVYKKKPRDVR